MDTQTDAISLEVLHRSTPCVRTESLETAWFQVGGTICNLRCHHCFISCSPENDKFGFMDLETVERYLAESDTLGVKEYYFTGGEPFANPQMCDILEAAISRGPSTVLTNATLFRNTTVDRLSAIAQSACHPLEFRVSLDGYSTEMNDPIRGEGSFERTMDGLCKLIENGFAPIITITRTWGCNERDDDVLAGFRKTLLDLGYEEPRIKVLPLLKLGAEVNRTGGYCDQARVTAEMLEGYDQRQLLCSTARLVTDRGVWVCPIVLDSPAARLGESLTESIRDYPLQHQACYTCFQYGAICANEATTAGSSCEA